MGAKSRDKTVHPELLRRAEVPGAFIYAMYMSLPVPGGVQRVGGHSRRAPAVWGCSA